jgi:hypothetical protein
LLTNFNKSEILRGSSENLNPNKFISNLIKNINAVNSSKSNQPASNSEIRLDKAQLSNTQKISKRQDHFFNFEIGDARQKGSNHLSQKQSSRSGNEYMQSSMEEKLNADDFSMFFNIRVMCYLIESK